MADSAVIERQEITVKVQRVIACGDVGIKEPAGGCVFHHKIYCSAYAVTLEIGGH